MTDRHKLLHYEIREHCRSYYFLCFNSWFATSNMSLYWRYPYKLFKTFKVRQ